MREFSRPRLVISRCIEFDRCRYNGDMIKSDIVRRLKDRADLLPICPEVEIGLGVPRNPVRVVMIDAEKHLIQPSTGLDVTERATSFSDSFLNSIDNIDGFILKSRSPSCGLRDVREYNDPGESAFIPRGSGIFGAEVRMRFPDLPVEDEARLLNIRIAEHFLTRAFTTASLSRVQEACEMDLLVRFHTENKLLFMMYDQNRAREMGRTVANEERRPIEEVLEEYRSLFNSSMMHIPTCTSAINVLMHSLGHFSERLKKEEKTFFLDSLDLYREGRVPLSVCLNLLMSWIVRFDDRYLSSQTFFAPYPPELIDIGLTDSCDRRDYNS